MNTNAELFHYASVAGLAEEFVAELQKNLNTQLVSLCGDIGRQTTTVERIEVLAGVAGKEASGHTRDEILYIVYRCPAGDFYKELFRKTSTHAHINKVKGNRFSSEKAIYASAGFPFIPPEMCEDVAKWEWAKDLQPLIRREDITGVVHNHTDWSDGVDRLDSFVNACQSKGYKFVVISDHSHNAHYAGGIKPDKVLRQFQVIDKLNKQLAPFKIFKSIECDVLVSGELDYDTELLSQFDLVIVSVHQQLKMAQEKATARLIKPIENPFTTILGQMTGRQLLVRPGYPVDFMKVIDACAANGMVIEINANLYRLDMDWSNTLYARKKRHDLH